MEPIGNSSLLSSPSRAPVYTIQFFVFLAVAMGIASVLVVSVVQRTRESESCAHGHVTLSDFLGLPIQGALNRPLRICLVVDLCRTREGVFPIARAPDALPPFP